MASKVFVRKIQDNLWQWRVATAEGQWVSDEFYTGDINLLKETIEHRLVWLMVPGANVVSQLAHADIKDRRQLIKTLPFELEEDIVDPVEDLHFAYGNIQNDTIPVVYGSAEYLQQCIDELEAIGAEVQRCVVDYLQLVIEPASWTILLEGDLLTAHIGVGLGFVVESDTAPLYFAALANNPPPSAIRLIADDDEGLDKLEKILPEAFLSNDELNIENALGCFWDLIDPSAIPILDFRSGTLARKLPFGKWWGDWKVPLIGFAAAFAIALGATWFAQAQVAKEQKQIIAQTDEIFRQAVPSGKITNPERQLQALLGGGGGSGKPSNAVKLITIVAPAITSFDDVVIRNFRYNADNAQLQMNIEASSFGTFESLRSKIAEKGYEVDIKSANVYGETHQAQLRVTEAG